MIQWNEGKMLKNIPTLWFHQSIPISRDTLETSLPGTDQTGILAVEQR